MSPSPPPPPSANARPAPPRTKAPPPSSPPPLNECVKTMVSLMRNGSALSTKHQADLTLAQIGYCLHLGRDQDRLSEFLMRSSNKDSQHESDNNNELPFSEMQAIGQLVTDPALFQCILCMLSPYNNRLKCASGSTTTGLSSHPPTNVNSALSSSGPTSSSLHHQKQLPRKRSPSEDSSNPTKLARTKLLLSPSPANRLSQHNKHHPSSGKAMDAQKGQFASKSNSPVVAATILYSVLQHVDHWPIQIIKAFAEDSFGPRIWVDDERCQMVVSNLKMSIESTDNGSIVSYDDDTSEANHADEVGSYYSNLISQAQKMTLTSASGTMTEVVSSSPNKKEPAMSSSQQQKAPSSKQARIQTKAAKSTNDSDSSSSSSGEEEVLETESSNAVPLNKQPKNNDDQRSHPDSMDVISNMSTASSSNSQNQFHSALSSTHLHILFQRKSLTKKRVRPRYQGHNLDQAHEAISEALADRLNSKSKQNSRLLQILPSFISIPRIRCLASRHLERWLQSPALAGLARTLFAKIVTQIHNVDPPLPEDVEVIDNILKMNLKSNLLSAHVENVTMIAKTIPTQTIAQQIFTHCLQGESSNAANGALKPNSDHFRFLLSVFKILDHTVASKSLASSVISITFNVLQHSNGHGDINLQFQGIRHLLSMVLDTLGDMYDGFLFVETIIESNKDKSDNAMAVNIAGRLIFECMLLVSRTIPSFAPNPNQFGASRKCNPKSSSIFQDVDQSSLDRFRKKMLSIRKIVLAWYVSDLCKFYHKEILREEVTRSADIFDERGAVVRGPGTPDYSSALDGKSFMEYDYRRSSFNNMMSSIRCLLFLSSPSSKEMKFFVSPLAASACEDLDTEEFQQIRFCCQYGVDVDDDMLQIILRSPNITPNTAISIIENLVLRCSSNSAAEIISCSSDTIWEMYRLSEFIPELRKNNGRDGSHELSEGEDFTEQVGKRRQSRPEDDFSDASLDLSKLPRLAHPHLWWRVTSIALVMCSISPEDVGKVLWKHHPTLRALIKMTTAQKYRFPTSDCDGLERDQIKEREEQTREEEAKIAELLFMPSAKKIKKPRLDVSPPLPHRGMRFSARQKEKHEKMMTLEREKQAAALHAENMKLRKLLRTVQKSIMLWDPKQNQRKPPKGSIDLLLSVNDYFDLAEKFRLCIDPDFLLQTIGEGRSAIERAYDWLIPIISSHPEIIDRLQPSASCFLLLRAYGAEGDKNRELLDLTAPLLTHVSNCLTGKYGDHHAQLAMDLLLQDIADESADRRRCSRKVLQEAIGNVKDLDSLPFHYNLGLCGWLFQLTHIGNSKSLIPLVIKYVSHALAYERGKVLSIYTMALFDYRRYLKECAIDIDFDFVSSLCELMAQRPHVCSDALDRFPDFRSLAVAEVKTAFDKAISSNANDSTPVSSLVVITLPNEICSDKNAVKTNVVVPSNLIQAAIILISNWQNVDCKDGEEERAEEIGKHMNESIMCLLKYLIIPFSVNNSDGEELSGAASAVYKHNGARAVSVEEWVLLAKARTDFVAKHAALASPDIFLPRLLLCCGMSRSSFVTMLHRISKMGESSPEPEKVFRDLLSPAAVSEWGLPRIGGRRVIKRKLFGRITAYIRSSRKGARNEEMQELDEASTSSFLLWLSSERSAFDTSKKPHSKHLNSNKTFDFVKISTNKSSETEEFTDLTDDGDVESNNDTFSGGFRDDVLSKDSLIPSQNVSEEYVRSCIVNDRCALLEQSLDLIATKKISGKEYGDTSAAKVLLASYGSLHHNLCFVRTMLKWVPFLTQDCGDSELWRLIFIERLCKSSSSCHFDVLLSLVCNCAMRWSNEHIAACQSWILSQQSKSSISGSIYSLKASLRFLVISSEQKSIHCFDFDNDAHIPHFAYVQTQERALSAINLALGCLESENIPTDRMGDLLENQTMKDPADTFIGRNIFPDWLVILFLIAKSGKPYLEMTIKHILECIDENPRRALYAVLLRLYSMFPLMINLGEPRLKNALLQASKDDSFPWLEWRCPLDSQVSEMLSNVTKSPHQRLLQSIMDIAKNHPLILVRHLHVVSQKLLDDGSGVDSDHQTLIKRGRIQGQAPEGDAVAMIGSRTVKVSIVQWGFSFNEPVWTSVIDILESLPGEVVFTCGLKTGLEGIFEAYLKLFLTHVLVLGSEGNISRIRSKFVKLLNSFKSSKPKSFENWAQQNVAGWGKTQDLISLSGMGSLFAAPVHSLLEKMKYGF